MGTRTTNLNFYMPDVGEIGWGAIVNADNWAVLDGHALGVFHIAPSSDSSAAVQAAVTEAASLGGGHILFHAGIHTMPSPITISGNRVTFRGLPGSMLSKEFHGDLFTVSTNILRTKFVDLWIDANGDTFTGAIGLFRGGSGYIDVNEMIVVDGADTIFSIEPNGASASWIRHSAFTIHANNVAAGAVIKNTGPDTQASPRFWLSSFGLSSTWWYRGDGLQTFYADDIYSNGFDFTGGNTDAATIKNCRMALFPQATNHATFRGENMIISDCHFGGDITVASDFDNGLFINNIQDTTYAFTDNAPNTSIVVPPRTPFYNMDHKVIDTAQLPAASAAMNGTILMEHVDATHCNLVVYKDNKRWKASFTES